VVADSVPTAEYQETRAKARAALRAVALAEKATKNE
jgi:anthranilate/para-aminobenzoate synthase component I